MFKKGGWCLFPISIYSDAPIHMMKWKYDANIQEYHLLYGKGILAKIQTNFTKHGRYIVTTLISGIYFSMRKQMKMEKHKNEWVAYRRQCKDKAEVQTYIQRKQDAVLRFLQARDKEMGS